MSIITTDTWEQVSDVSVLRAGDVVSFTWDLCSRPGFVYQGTLSGDQDLYVRGDDLVSEDAPAGTPAVFTIRVGAGNHAPLISDLRRRVTQDGPPAPDEIRTDPDEIRRDPCEGDALMDRDGDVWRYDGTQWKLRSRRFTGDPNVDTGWEGGTPVDTYRPYRHPTEEEAARYLPAESEESALRREVARLQQQIDRTQEARATEMRAFARRAQVLGMESGMCADLEYFMEQSGIPTDEMPTLVTQVIVTYDLRVPLTTRPTTDIIRNLGDYLYVQDTTFRSYGYFNTGAATQDVRSVEFRNSRWDA